MNTGNNSFLLAGPEAAEPAEIDGAWRTGPGQGDPQVSIRPFQPSDRASICRLCCETGFLGEPVDSLFQDRELFAELYTRAYLQHESEWILVAEKHKQVVGYLLGSVRPHFDLVLLRSGLVTTSRILLRLAGGRYDDHPRSRQFIRWLLLSGFWEQPRHPQGAAHLHVQVAKEHRTGLGIRMWQHYQERLRAAGVKSCYGAFYSRPARRPEIAYSRFGFRVFDRRRTTIFEPEVKELVEVVCVWKPV